MYTGVAVPQKIAVRPTRCQGHSVSGSGWPRSTAERAYFAPPLCFDQSVKIGFVFGNFTMFCHRKRSRPRAACIFEDIVGLKRLLARVGLDARTGAALRSVFLPLAHVPA